MTRLASLLPAQVVALVPGSALAQRTVAPPPRSDPIHACSHPGQEHLRAAVEAVANADIDADAPVIWQARFTPRGLLVIVDAGLEEVVLMGGDLEPIRTVGRRGRGPGACSYPVYAVQGKDGTIFVLDRSPARLLLFDSLGNPLRTVSLPIVVGRSVAVDDTAAYVSAPVLWTVPDFQRALVVRYDLARGELTTLLETGPSWRSRPPTYNSSGALTLVRAGRDGRLYLAFPEAYRIWRIDGPGRYTEVVEGCVPDALLEEYREPWREMQLRRTLDFIANSVFSPVAESSCGAAPSTARGTARSSWSALAASWSDPGCSRPRRSTARAWRSILATLSGCYRGPWSRARHGCTGWTSRGCAEGERTAIAGVKGCPSPIRHMARHRMNGPAIETRDLVKRYRDVIAVDGLSLSVARGEIYAFLGLNGAGKTTTIRMLLGMVRPTAGEAYVLGTRIGIGGEKPWDSVGYLVDTAHAYPDLSVRENLELYRRLRPGTDPRAVGHVIERLGLATYADRRAGTPSRGNLQRLGLARALLHEPRLLILDEPANGLDPAGIVEIRNLLLELARGRDVAVFMSSHILGEVSRLADRIGIIHRGRLLQELDAPELERNRKRRLVVRTRDAEAACAVLNSTGVPAQLTSDGAIEVRDEAAIEQPDRVATLLVQAGHAPTMLNVEQEELEDYFLRLVGPGGGGGE